MTEGSGAWQADWRTDWSNVPMDAWLWVADSQGQVLPMLGSVARALKEEERKAGAEVVDARYAFQVLAFQVLETPEHPNVQEIHDAAESWYGRTW